MVALYSGTCDTLAELSHAAAANGIVAQTPPVQVLTSGSPTEIYIRVASAFEGIFNVNISPNLNL
jgi:hypothetical protein